MANEEKRTASVGIRMRPSLKAAVDQLAREDGRTTAQLIERLLIRYVKEKGMTVD